MAPTLLPGDIIFVSKLKPIKPGILVVANTQSVEIIKRIKSIKEDKVYLCGDNINRAHNTVVERTDIIGGVLFRS